MGKPLAVLRDPETRLEFMFADCFSLSFASSFLRSRRAWLWVALRARALACLSAPVRGSCAAGALASAASGAPSFACCLVSADARPELAPVLYGPSPRMRSWAAQNSLGSSGSRPASAPSASSLSPVFVLLLVATRPWELAREESTTGRSPSLIKCSRNGAIQRTGSCVNLNQNTRFQ